jgi:hypothetical protein
MGKPDIVGWLEQTPFRGQIPTLGDQFKMFSMGRETVLEVVEVAWDEEEREANIRLKPVIAYESTLAEEK